MKRPMPRTTPLVATCFVAVAGGCSGDQSALHPRGDSAHALAVLIGSFSAVLAVVWFAVVFTLLVVLRRRSRAEAPDVTHDDRLQRRVEVATAGTVVVILCLAAGSFAATHVLVSDDPEPVVIKVRAYQWWWDVRYIDDEATKSVVTANEIHVPVGRPVRIELAAADVIHSFWVPNLAGKVDAIPGRDNTLRFVAREAGVYRGQCAEFCGLQHAHMAFVVVAEAPSAFDAWRVAQSTQGRLPSDDEQASGRAVFESRQCGACHAIRGTSATGNVGPDLTHVASRATIAAGMFPTTRGTLAAWIADPQTIKPGNNMPLVPLSADELSAVSAYLASLR
jgi:cytochrome c oxidase subunit 2